MRIRCQRFEHVHALFHAGEFAVEVKHWRAGAHLGDTADEGTGHFTGKQPGHIAAERNGVRLTGGSGQNSHRGFGGHALVTRHTIDHAGAYADTVQAVFLGIHLGGLFVAVFVCPIKRRHGAAVVERAISRHRAGVSDSFHLAGLGGFKHIHGTHHIHQRAGHRVGPAKRHLQSRQMNDGARTGFCHHVFDRFCIGDVTGVPGDALERGFIHQQRGTPLIDLHIKCVHGDTGPLEQGQGPAAYATTGTGDQHRSVKFIGRHGKIFKHVGLQRYRAGDQG